MAVKYHILRLSFDRLHDIVFSGACRARKGERHTEIHGLQKLTLLDYPGHTACTVFTARCNWRCPFCHNAPLVLDPSGTPVLPEEGFFAFLEKRKGLLDGVAVTGGEPTLQKDLPEFLRRVRGLGFLVKLDTNGTNPDMLARILGEGLADYVAMDVKAGRPNYAAATGTLRPRLDAVEKSAAMLMAGETDFEFRTTVVKGIHSEEDFRDIAAWLPGNEKYFLQAFADSGELISGGCSAFSKEETEAFRQILLPAIPAAEIRGMD